ncbi:MAG: 4a-hydroxytetrahydrobiopterin dehydratase [Acidobacteria bacterium]|nr:4a-hydroxytetrahydrobiopterin dehydratase [Acidobacteriota bacterium]
MKLTDEQIAASMSRVSNWRREGGREGESIVRDFKFEDFKKAMAFVNSVAVEAESMDHHPDILIHGWNNVRLSITTHSKGGLTEKDFSLAVKIDVL